MMGWRLERGRVGRLFQHRHDRQVNRLLLATEVDAEQNIEARMVEIRNNRLKELGFDWLLGAFGGEVQGAIFRNMSERAATNIREELEFMGPVRVKDVEEAQQKVVAVIRRLEESGAIVIVRGGEDQLVA